MTDFPTACQYKMINFICYFDLFQQCATFGYAQYDIMAKYYQDVSMAVNLRQGQTSVKLDCNWEDVKNVLETPHGAKCTVVRYL